MSGGDNENTPTEDQDLTVAEETEEITMSMSEFLEDVIEQDQTADAVLGGADDSSCTYNQGYVHRQPLYSCKTCSIDKPAALCLGCSIHCHEGHDLIELYTKRNIRCDCGNSLFINFKCKLDPFKDDLNEKNEYNQNYKGAYCICQKPYPDPEDEVDDTMIQCVVCEDWYHGRHLEANDVKECEEMICHLCMAKLPFLWSYIDSEISSDGGSCKLKNISVSNEGQSRAGAAFWTTAWRERLCRCSSCVELFNTHKISFLLDENDSVAKFEKLNLEKARQAQEELSMRALNSMGRVQQVEYIQGYNDLKSALVEYFNGMNKDKVVSATDIREFFDDFKAKRRRVDIPNNCR